MTYRKRTGSDTWHFCFNCPDWPASDYVEQQEPPKFGPLCNECRSMRRDGLCQSDSGALSHPSNSEPPA